MSESPTTSTRLLPLLADGSCSIQNTCLQHPSEVWDRCPQHFKCGTCVAWSPRKENSSTRNSGQCLLDRNNTQYLDCNTPLCPYYRPRAGTPAAEAWHARPAAARQKEVKQRTRSMSRDAPPPSAEAVAHAAFQTHADAVADVGAPVLAARLTTANPDGLPPLLERFRGGSATVRSASGAVEERTLALEAVWARVALLRGSMRQLEVALASSSLPEEVRQKTEKDLAGMAGSMTTFNLLFASKDDGFRGSGKGD